MSIFQPDLYTEKVVMITGGGSGICFAIAKSFAEHGASVAIISRNEDKLQAAAKQIEASTGRTCFFRSADVRNVESVNKAVKEIVSELGPIDILVNGAAGNFLATAENLSPNGYKTVYEIDALGSFIVSKAVYEQSLSKRGGSIINISATLQYVGTAMQIHAASAKAAVDVQTRTLAVEWGPKKIRVNGVAPGPIAGTEGIDRLVPPHLLNSMKAKNPLQRLGETTEIADACLFLASPAASYVNGAILVVDGGQWLNANQLT
ncbi:MAG: SDR family oxidoreductase [Myxococcota bacterium]|nr:SDR family oxidoreductase [Myxococcota bacterium]